MKKFIVLAAFVLIFPLFRAQAQAGKSLSLDETLKELKAELSWEPFFASGTLIRGDNRVKFCSGLPGEQGMALFDGRKLLTLPLPYLEKGLLRFPEAFVTAVKANFFPQNDENTPRNIPPGGETAAVPHRIAAIIIDPGHGGKDSGAIGNHKIAGKNLHLMEKNITLSVSKKLSALLSSAYPGKKILLTRTKDSFPTHEERVNLANTVPLKDNEAIIFISVHVNGHKSPIPRGYEAWFLPPQTERELIDRKKYTDNSEIIPILNDMLQAEFISESTRMGRFILNRLKESFGDRIPSRGLKAENWYVVRNARMPAILVELGFISNLEDAKLMADEKGLNTYAEALYKGITDFVTEFERSGGYTASLHR